MSDEPRQLKEPQPPTSEGNQAAEPTDAEKILAENKRKNASGLSWDETTPKPGEDFNRATEMGEAD